MNDTAAGGVTRVLILGAGGHGQVVADALESLAPYESEFRVVGFLDAQAPELPPEIAGLPVLGIERDWRNFPEHGIIVAIGDNRRRAAAFRRLGADGATIITAIHRTACISSKASIRCGLVICAGVVVNPGAVVGDDTILNTGCIVEHHCRLEAHVHIAPGARVAGDCSIGEGALVGVGATILPGRSVGEWATVGAGAVVVRDVLPGQRVMGNPATIRDA